jgi:hypothetical protein
MSMHDRRLKLAVGVIRLHGKTTAMQALSNL